MTPSRPLLTLLGVAVVGANAADFTVNLAGLPNTVPALTGQTTFTVTFTPGAAGPRQAFLRILSDDGDEPMSVFALTGEGLAPALSPLQSWRESYFGTTADAGPSADAFDYDGDGLPNLLEYAFALDPTDAASATLPAVTTGGAALAYDFTAPSGATGVTYAAEWSATLAAGSWAPVPDTATGAHHVFSVSLAGRPRAFLRLVITPTP